MEKRHYIKDVLKKLNVPKSTFLNWEKAGKIPKPKRDPMSRYRYWTDEDLKKLRKITGR